MADPKRKKTKRKMTPMARVKAITENLRDEWILRPRRQPPGVAARQWERELLSNRQTPPEPVPTWARMPGSPNHQGHIRAESVGTPHQTLGPAHLLIPRRFNSSRKLDPSQVRDMRGGQPISDSASRLVGGWLTERLRVAGEIYGNRDTVAEGRAKLAKMGGPEHRARVRAGLRDRQKPNTMGQRLTSSVDESRLNARGQQVLAAIRRSDQPVKSMAVPRASDVARTVTNVLRGRRSGVPKAANPVGPVALNPSVTTTQSTMAYARGGQKSRAPVKPKRRSGSGGSRLM